MTTPRFPLPVLGESAPVEPQAVDLPDEASFAPGRQPGSEHGFGRTYWRSVEEQLHGEAALPHRDQEFPPGAFDVPKGFARRDFLQLMGASVALAGLTACTEKPVEKILAYTKAPDGMVPGNPLHYATALVQDGLALGVLATSWEGRPVKVEGNPTHPVSRGATGPHAQAELATLFDPFRARVLKERGAGRSWRGFREAMRVRSGAWEKDGGAGLRFLSAPSSSPLTGSLREAIVQRFPRAKFHAWSATPRDSVYDGTTIAFGKPLEPHYLIEKADVILSLDADFLEARPDTIDQNLGFANRREPQHPAGLNRLYVVEPRFSITGGMADHRLRLRSADIEGFALALAAELGKTVPGLSGFRSPAGLTGERAKFVTAVAKDLAGKRGAALVIPGERQTALTHAVAQAINASLGAVGATVTFSEPAVLDTATGRASWQSLVDELRAGKVDTLVISAWNPVFTAPGDVDLVGLLRKVPNAVYLGLHDDETSRAVNWFLPAAHPFESWGDARAREGTLSIVQPLIQPLFGGISEAELLTAFLTDENKPYDRLKALHASRAKGDFDSEWETWLASGVVPGTANAPVTPTLQAERVRAASSQARPAPGGLELDLVHDYKILDGRYSLNSWLQELPDPITKVTWDNVAQVGPGLAKQLGLENGDLLLLTVSGRSVQVPAWVQPGHSDEAVTVSIGYGRKQQTLGVKDADEPVVVGHDVYPLRSASSPWFTTGLEVKKVGRSYPISTTQVHNDTEGRPIALMQTLEEFEKHPEAAELRPPVKLPGGKELEGSTLPSVQLAVDYSKQQYKWAMAVDMSRCTGCNACVVACQSENNIPVVGKYQVGRGREMQWIRMDRYYSGSAESPQMVNQPMFCQHCETAPCEYVCPVNATVHSDEGLNDMVYNRCIGTRYCSNNCPYKVRHFNYLHWTQDKSQVEKMLMNPDVTVRSRGVMEKCTYCVQRIERTRIAARIENRGIGDGELKTACQQACPTSALTFGSLHDPKSQVSQRHADPRRFDVLHELNTRPRTVYLTKIKNPNPELG
ncbi:MAG TPA: TAT-variant-translocated molybdopterin oxidoreductase [Myxococcaceae bacterium]|nr:TAT-variant-translocated molybdopterin oxidoreductase [Myxococcaceae bacterium]